MSDTGNRCRWLAFDLLTSLAAVFVAWHPAGFGRPDTVWAPSISVAAAALIALLHPLGRHLLPWPGATPATLAMVWAAIYGCVPETSDQMFHVAAALTVLGLSEWVLGTVSPSWVHSLAVALVMWAGLYGSAGRPTAIVGALFALWPLVLPALTVAALPSFAVAAAGARWTVVALATGASIATSRSGALGSSVAAAVEDVVVFAVASAVAAVPFAAWASRRTGASARTAGSLST